MGIPLRAGRDFNDRDTADSTGVVIINERLAHMPGLDGDPIGKRITLDDPRDSSKLPRWLSVVGVVNDVKQESWIEAPWNEVYLPFQQSGEFYANAAGRYSSMTIVVRTTVEPGSLVLTAQETVRALDRSVPVSNVVTMEQVIADALWQPRFNLRLIGLFAGLALLLAAVGLYGVTSYSVAQRTHEVGLRMALGAQRSDVIKLVLMQGMKLTLIGVSGGLLATAALTRLMTALLFGVSATDPKTFGTIALVLIGVALLACLVPAHRATRVDPMVALRYE
jgi:putative ABC transport system permease protein